MTAMLLILMIGQITGRVVDVYDGDSITIRTADDTVKIRLLHIDAPERGQAYGTRAKQALSEAVFGKTVTVHGTKKDRYKRLLGDVWIDGRSVNLEMVKGGLAWAYLEFKPPQEYIQAESIARGKRAGLKIGERTDIKSAHESRLKAGGRVR